MDFTDTERLRLIFKIAMRLKTHVHSYSKTAELAGLIALLASSSAEFLWINREKFSEFRGS